MLLERERESDLNPERLVLVVVWGGLVVVWVIFWGCFHGTEPGYSPATRFGRRAQ